MANLRILVSMLISLPLQAAVVYYDNGVSVYIPESTWEVKAHPKGFNSLPYSESNPKGQLPFFGGWPEYESCSGLVPCDEPYFITTVEEDCTPEGELSLGGQPCK